MNTILPVNIDELLDELEKSEFSAKINIASDLKTARAIIEADETISHLIDACKASEQNQAIVVNRIKRLASIDIDSRYESPWDAVLTALVLVIDSVNSKFIDLAELMAQRAPQTWWARQLTNNLIWQREEQLNAYFDLEEIIAVTDYDGPILSDYFINMWSSSSKEKTGDTQSMLVTSILQSKWQIKDILKLYSCSIAEALDRISSFEFPAASSGWIWDKLVYDNYREDNTVPEEISHSIVGLA